MLHYGHVVSPGSSVDAIAAQYNTSQDTLLRLNGLTSPKDLKAGAVLDVPLPSIYFIFTFQFLPSFLINFMPSTLYT